MMERLEIWATSDCMVSNYEYLPEKDVNPCAWNVLVLNYMSGPPHAALECFHRMHLLKFEPSLLLHSNMEQILPSSNWKGSQATHKKPARSIARPIFSKRSYAASGSLSVEIYTTTHCVRVGANGLISCSGDMRCIHDQSEV